MLNPLQRAGLAAQITGPVLGPEDEGFADEEFLMADSVSVE